MKHKTKIRIVILLLCLVFSYLVYDVAYHWSYKHTQTELPGSDIKSVSPDARTPSKNVTNDALYLAKIEENRVVIYYATSMKLYDETSIELADLPSFLVEELRIGKLLKTQQELYDFLENYSS